MAAVAAGIVEIVARTTAVAAIGIVAAGVVVMTAITATSAGVDAGTSTSESVSASAAAVTLVRPVALLAAAPAGSTPTWVGSPSAAAPTGASGSSL